MTPLAIFVGNISFTGEEFSTGVVKIFPRELYYIIEGRSFSADNFFLGAQAG